MNPFDLKSALLARHAQHVVLIHFPIALFLASVGFDLVAQWTRKQVLAAVAYCNLLLAAISSLPVIASGLLAWRWQLEGQHLKGVLLMHLVMGVAAASLIWLIWWLQFRRRKDPEPRMSAYLIALELIAVMVVAMTAHLGGFLSGVNGIG